MIGENLAALFLVYARPVAAIGRILDRGRLFFALVIALGVSLMLHIPEIRHADVIHAPSATAPNTVDGDEPDLPAPPRPSASELAVTIWTGIDPEAFLAGLGAIILGFVPAIIGLRAITGWGSFGVLMRRDYMSMLMATLMVWAAAYLPAAVILWIAGPQATLWPLPVASNVYFLILAALAIRTLLGINFAPALGLSMVGAIASMGGLVIFDLTGSLHTFVMSPFFLLYGAYFFYSTVLSNVRSLGDGLRSRQHFQQQLEIATNNPRDADAHYQLGLIHLKRRQRSEAAARFKRAIEIDPNEAEPHYQLGRIALEEKRYDDAVASLSKAASLDEKLSQGDVWRDLGAAYFGAGKLDEAEAALKKFTDRREYDPEGLYWYGRVLAAKGRANDAKDLFQRAIEAVKTMPRHRRPEVRQWGSQAKSQKRKLATN